MLLARSIPAAGSQPVSLQPAFARRPAARGGQQRGQPVRAAEQAAWGGSGQQKRLIEERVVFLVPTSEPDTVEPVPVDGLTQRGLDGLLLSWGASGFRTANGAVSRELRYLPVGEVEVVMPPVPSQSKQLLNLQQAHDNLIRADELKLQVFLRTLAEDENPGARITLLQSSPYQTAKGQDLVQIDAGIRAGEVLSLGEHKSVLGVNSVYTLLEKFDTIKEALEEGTSPDLTAALQGVSHVQLFLAGNVLQRGLEVQDLVKRTAKKGISVVLPSGAALSCASRVPAVQL